MQSITYLARVRVIGAMAAFAIAGLAPVAGAQDLTESIAKAAGVPQIPAFLPDKYSVPRSEALPIDGLWMVSTIKKKIRIEQGRAYAADPWLHMFVLKVQPDMVVLQNFRRTGPGRYAADDLPLMGPAEMTVNAEGNLDVAVSSMFGPVKYALVRVDPQYPAALTAEIQAATGQQVAIPDYSAPPVNSAPLPGMPTSTPTNYPVQPAVEPPAYQPVQQPVGQPVAPAAGAPPADCTPIGVDPDTGQTICAY